MIVDAACAAIRSARSFVLVGTLLAAGHVASAQTASFTGSALQPGMGFYRPGYVPLNVMCGGGAVGDFNNDGYQDIFVLCGGSQADCLFINNADGTFTDLASLWGVAEAHYGAGATVGDYNSDGWLDIYVTSHGSGQAGYVPGRHRLYRNNGDATFSEVAIVAGVHETALQGADGFGAAFGDYDLDGDLDLFVAGWKQHTNSNCLFRNEGDGTFTNVTTSVFTNDISVVMHGFAPVFVDMNDDLYPELLVAADFESSRFLLNDTMGGFTDITPSTGTGLDGNGMGQTVADFNSDGLLDWYVTSIYSNDVANQPNIPGDGNMLYINQGANTFAETSQSAGVKDGGWGWGTVAVDVNNDGHMDLFETNGFPNVNDSGQQEWMNEQSYLFINDGTANFTEQAIPSGLVNHQQGRAVARIDIENDGDQDIIVFPLDDDVQIYENSISGPANYLRVFLDTSGVPQVAPDGFGAKVTATVGGHTMVRPITGESQYLANSELSAHFGLGSATEIDTLTVAWPDATVDEFENVSANRTVYLPYGGCPGDVNRDLSVNVNDIAAVIFRLGDSGTAGEVEGDADGNGTVDTGDISYVLFRLSTCG